ncbi:hypothetical protein EVAR_34671_1 [Eumeta japonica]|uniref:Uncharacterized protein n=1 Tax=Eumeta variegata TaxID=151549 RepID=A0A4C1VIA4_EUMVA|nr:hypothetical protein EVAR_34671_1 [Eumeta japonica]
MGINPLDSACREHDVAYSKNRENVHLRNEAYRVLSLKTLKRVFNRDAPMSGRAVALGIASAMAAKAKCGLGIKNKSKIKKKGERSKKLLKLVIDLAKSSMSNGSDSIKSALNSARNVI